MDVQEYWNRLKKLDTELATARELHNIGFRIVEIASSQEKELINCRRKLKESFFPNATPEQLAELEKLAQQESN